MENNSQSVSSNYCKFQGLGVGHLHLFGLIYQPSLSVVLVKALRIISITWALRAKVAGPWLHADGAPPSMGVVFKA